MGDLHGKSNPQLARELLAHALANVKEKNLSDVRSDTERRTNPSC